MPLTPPATLYRARVSHQRLQPKTHGFAYDLWALKVSLDDLPALQSLNLLGGSSPLSLNPADFGPRNGSDLKPWFQQQLQSGGYGAQGPLELLFLPRLNGRGFAPITVWMAPDALLFEVHNTAGEAHSYLMNRHELSQQQAWKRLWVSPFSPMHGRYDFSLRADTDRLDLRVRLYGASGLALTADLRGPGQPLNRQALHAIRRAPGLQGRRTFAAILWQAFRLWRLGLTIKWGPFAPTTPTSTGQIKPSTKARHLGKED